MTYNTDYYISEISKKSNRYGDLLLQMLDELNKFRLMDVTYDEAKRFYEKIVEKQE